MLILREAGACGEVNLISYVRQKWKVLEIIQSMYITKVARSSPREGILKVPEERKVCFLG